jgi:hypothetical protein
VIAQKKEERKEGRREGGRGLEDDLEVFFIECGRHLIQSATNLLFFEGRG